MDRSGAGCVCVCVRVRSGDVMCVSLLHHSHLWPPLLQPSARPSAPPPRTKCTVTRRECAARRARATITCGFSRPASCARLSVAHNLSLSCGGQLEAHVSHLAPGDPRSEVSSCVGGRKQFSSPNSSRPSCLCDVGLICVSGHIYTGPLRRHQVWPHCYF